MICLSIKQKSNAKCTTLVILNAPDPQDEMYMLGMAPTSIYA
jgi:hypothetical protein